MTGPPSRPVPKLRTIDEVAELLNISRRTVQRLIRSVPYPRIGSGAPFAFQTPISRHSWPGNRGV